MLLQFDDYKSLDFAEMAFNLVAHDGAMTLPWSMAAKVLCDPWPSKSKITGSSLVGFASLHVLQNVQPLYKHFVIGPPIVTAVSNSTS